MKYNKILVCLMAVILVFSMVNVAAEGQKEEEKPLIGFITNGPYEFWTYAAAAVEVMEEDLDVEVEFMLPPNGLPEEQRRFMEQLVTRGVDGIGISVTDPDNATPFINDLINNQGVPFVMFDSDAPDSDRLAYVGMSNYATGRMAGEAIMEVLPDGGDFMISVGRLDAQNAIERRQGIIDEMNGEEYQKNYPGEMTPNDPDMELGDGKWILLETRTDGGDQSKAKSNAEDAILKFGDDLDLIVGMWSYSSPAVISAVKNADLLGEIEIIGFDMEQELLQAVKDGHAYMALGQDPFTYAVETITILEKVIRGEEPDIPEDGLVEVPAIEITQENIDEVWDMYKSQLSEGREFIEEKVETEE